MQLKIDLHIHSLHSDGHGSIEEILKTARSKGLDGLAITDHDTLEGYFEAKALDSDLLILPGFEATTDAGHLLVLGLDQLPPGVGRLRYEELIRWARGLGGLTVLAHPAVVSSSLGRWMRCRPDAVEVMNASYPSSRYFVRRGLTIAMRLGLPAVGGSDAHFAETVGDAYTVVEMDNPRRVHVLEAVRAGSARFEGGISSIPFRRRFMMGLRYLFHSSI